MMLRKNLLTAITCACACLVSTGVAAQWQWIEKDGSKVFSDRPPPFDTPEKNILRQPGGMRTKAPAVTDTPAPVSTDGADATAKPGLAAPKVSGVDKELEEKKKQTEAAETARKKAEETKQAKARTDNCARARQGKTTLDSGVRIAQTNAQGERIIMDDTARAAEAKRMDGIIATDCK